MVGVPDSVFGDAPKRIFSQHDGMVNLVDVFGLTGYVLLGDSSGKGDSDQELKGPFVNYFRGKSQQ